MRTCTESNLSLIAVSEFYLHLISVSRYSILSTPLCPEACFGQMGEDQNSHCVPLPSSWQGVQSSGPGPSIALQLPIKSNHGTEILNSGNWRPWLGMALELNCRHFPTCRDYWSRGCWRYWGMWHIFSLDNLTKVAKQSVGLAKSHSY